MEKRQEVIRQMKELEAATETTTAAFDDPDFQNEAANARYQLYQLIFLLI